MAQVITVSEGNLVLTAPGVKRQVVIDPATLFALRLDKPVLNNAPAGTVHVGEGSVTVEPGAFAQRDVTAQRVMYGDLHLTRDTTAGAADEAEVVDMTVVVTLAAEADQVRVRVQVENRSAWRVREVACLRVNVADVGTDDALSLPTNPGELMTDPLGFMTGPVGGAYPGYLSMQWADVSGPTGGVYLSAYQHGAEGFDLVADKPDEAMPTTLRLTYRWHPFLAAAPSSAHPTSWRSPDMAIALHTGDWHQAADLYRAHFGATLADPGVPSWMKDGFHGWVQVCGQFEDEPGQTPRPRHLFAELPAIYERIRQVGLDTIHYYGWSGWGHDTAYPVYDAAPNLGGDAQLTDVIKDIRKRGGRVILYMNGRIVDPDTNYWDAGGAHDVLLQENGDPIVETFNTSVEYQVVCPAATHYRKWMAAEVASIMDRYAPDAIQIDQIACAPSHLCFSAEHTSVHPTPATNWLPGHEALLSACRAAGRSRNHEFFVWIEGTADRFGQFYDVHQGHGEDPWQIKQSLPEQFRYTYPNHIVTGISDGIDRLCRSFIQGKPFDFHLSNLDDAEFATQVSRLVALRKAHMAYFGRGRFVDTQGFAWTVRNGDDADVDAKAIRRDDDGGLAVALWNRTNERRVVELTVNAEDQWKGWHTALGRGEGTLDDAKICVSVEGRVELVIFER